GHVAFFAEYWTLRTMLGEPTMLVGSDALYDSARIAHDTRWELPLPSRARTLDYLARQLDATLAAPTRDERSEYFNELVLFHEDMHGEATIYTRQTLGYAAPKVNAMPPPGAPERIEGDAAIPAGRYSIGANLADGFVFDNEKWMHEVELDAFKIARTPVTCEEFSAFIADRGYEREALWSEEGWAWRLGAAALHPVLWRRSADGWERRHFARWLPVRQRDPVAHVNAYEAEAYCRWAGRRLPSEFEWEAAASGPNRRRYPWGEDSPSSTRANLDAWYGDCTSVDAFADAASPFGCVQMLGNVWEWTASTFEAYAGFSPDPYEEYSQPWFGSQRSLRGGAWSTRARMISTRWRNFYLPQRRDIITGFRTCTL
ncbi:MAG TPA: selenoneine synthase SenA, partial [Candidatus Dormibacteraeota bacterium]|nr:selenoneine synthase SenA [Candidatus Dormibacteraeota bacterium]